MQNQEIQQYFALNARIKQGEHLVHIRESN